MAGWISLPGFVLAQPLDTSGTMKSGWFDRPPYQKEITRNGQAILSGLDIHIARELFRRSGYRTSFAPMSWSAMMEGLEQGRIDFVMGSYFDEDRLDYACYSVPYRTEHTAVYYHKELASIEAVENLSEFLDLLKTQPLRAAVIDKYAYGSRELNQIMEQPPATLTLVPSRNHLQSLEMTLEEQTDLFLANPVIIDSFLAESKYGQYIRKLRIATPEIPVSILFSRKAVSAEQIERFNTEIEAMRGDKTLRWAEISFLLPAYLGITTAQTWFTILTLLGITAFCVSGVLLARKERYNLFGAIVLAALPAIGGGVLRDIFTGADHVFVLENPAYILVALTAVFLSFIFFKVYDFVLTRLDAQNRRFNLPSRDSLNQAFNRIYRFMDAWAVAAFTVVGAGVAMEMGLRPFWLWGPAMAVVTSSGGVVLRDIVRADFNIEILKQDSYAEISILGGLVYTWILTILPWNQGLEIVFYPTMGVVLLLFAARSVILWKGWQNPLQFGAMHTHPLTRLAEFTEEEPRLWQLLTEYYAEDEDNRAAPAAHSELESLHNRFMYAWAGLRKSLDKVVAEPLTEDVIQRYRECNSRLELAASLEKNLYSFIHSLVPVKTEDSPAARQLLQHIHESLKAMVETAHLSIESGEVMDFSMLEKMTSSQQERFNHLREKYASAVANDRLLAMILRTTHKVERVIYILGDYAMLRLDKSEARTGSAANRKAQQAQLLG